GEAKRGVPAVVGAICRGSEPDARPKKLSRICTLRPRCRCPGALHLSTLRIRLPAETTGVECRGVAPSRPRLSGIGPFVRVGCVVVCSVAAASAPGAVIAPPVSDWNTLLVRKARKPGARKPRQSAVVEASELQKAAENPSRLRLPHAPRLGVFTNHSQWL